MRTCSKCNQDRSDLDFVKSNNYCKSCRSEISRIWRLENKEKIRLDRKKRRAELQSKRADTCRRCGFKPDHVCQLTIDHIDGSKGNEDPSNLQTLCHNCHHLKTYVERKDRSLLVIMKLIP